jgi:hypothetical protein
MWLHTKRFVGEPKKTTVEAEQKYLRKEASLQNSSPGLESYDTLAKVSKNQDAEAFLIYRHTLSLIETAIEKNSLKRHAALSFLPITQKTIGCLRVLYLGRGTDDHESDRIYDRSNVMCSCFGGQANKARKKFRREAQRKKKSAWYWNLCRSSNSYCISDEQRRSPSPTPSPTPARTVPQQKPDAENCASKRDCGDEPETIGTRRRISLSPSYSLLHNCLIPHKSTVACYVLPFIRQQWFRHVQLCEKIFLWRLERKRQRTPP